jgi:hypothetical protein
MGSPACRMTTSGNPEGRHLVSGQGMAESRNDVPFIFRTATLWNLSGNSCIQKSGLKFRNMKKCLFFLISAVITGSVCGQSAGRNFIGLGVISINTETQAASNTGIHLLVGLGNFYFDISNNLSFGSNPQILNAGQATGTDNLNLGVVNVGYMVRSGRFSVVPLVGWAWSGVLYKRFLSQDLWTFQVTGNKFNAGTVVIAGLTNNMGLYAGFGLQEKFKAGISFRF